MTQSDDVLQLSLLGEAAQNAEFAMFVVNDEGEHVALNDCVTRVLGYTRSELMKLRAHELSDAVEPVLARAKQSADVELRRKDGSTVRGEYRAVATKVASLPYLLVLFTPA
jgi:PAS domain S-box-containing protein